MVDALLPFIGLNMHMCVLFVSHLNYFQTHWKDISSAIQGPPQYQSAATMTEKKCINLLLFSFFPLFFWPNHNNHMTKCMDWLTDHSCTSTGHCFFKWMCCKLRMCTSARVLVLHVIIRVALLFLATVGKVMSGKNRNTSLMLNHRI